MDKMFTINGYNNYYNNLIDYGYTKEEIYNKIIPTLNFSRTKKAHYNELLQQNYTKKHNNILNTWLYLSEKLNLTNSLELAYLYEYLLINGYLSYNNKNYYNDEDRLFVPGLCFIDIYRGNGVCYEFSNMLSDFLNNAGYKSFAIINTVKYNNFINYNNYGKISDKLKSKEIILPPVEKIKKIETKHIINEYDHAATLINEGNLCYIFDPTHNVGYNIEDINNASLISGDSKMYINPFISIMSSNNHKTLEYVRDYILKNDYNSPYNDTTLVYTLNKCIHLFNDNKGLFDEYYSKTKKDINKIVKASDKRKIKKLI